MNETADKTERDELSNRLHAINTKWNESCHSTNANAKAEAFAEMSNFAADLIKALACEVHEHDYSQKQEEHARHYIANCLAFLDAGLPDAMKLEEHYVWASAELTRRKAFEKADICRIIGDLKRRLSEFENQCLCGLVVRGLRLKCPKHD